VEFTTPNKFFAELEEEASNLCCWSGELYLELHNGTYTTQAQVGDLTNVVCNDIDMLGTLSNVSVKVLYVEGGPKKPGLYLRVDNFAPVSGRKACDMSKVCKFCL